MGFKGRIEVLPNCIDVDAFIPQFGGEENSIGYFGRLSKEKGLVTLIKAVKGISGVRLKIIGEGPIRPALESLVSKEKVLNVDFLGYKGGGELEDEIRSCRFLVLPSEWYENNPRSVVEGFALGKPVIGANIGGIPELVRDSVTGLLFDAGNAQDL